MIFTAWACVFQILETIFPNPFPGIRLGLANMITLVVLVQMGYRAALKVTFLRIGLSSLLLGSFLSPGFIISFFAGITSTLAMIITLHIAKKIQWLRLSLISVSQIGAIVHNSMQLVWVYLILIHHSSIWLLFPWLIFSGLIMGWITGIIGIRINQTLDKSANYIWNNTTLLVTQTTVPSIDSLVQKTIQKQLQRSQQFPMLRLTVFTSVIVAITTSYNLAFLLSCSCIIMLLSIYYQFPFSHLLSGIRHMKAFLLFSFIIPVLFTSTGTVIFHFTLITITQQGLIQGATFAARLIGMLLLSTFYVQTTDLNHTAKTIAKLSSQASKNRIQLNHWIELAGASWQLIPIFMNKTWDLFHGKAQLKRTLTNVITSLSELIITSLSTKNK